MDVAVNFRKFFIGLNGKDFLGEFFAVFVLSIHQLATCNQAKPTYAIQLLGNQASLLLQSAK